MKKAVTVLLLILLFNTSRGQGNFEIGTNVIGVGFGVGSSYGVGSTYGSQTPAINLQYERGIWSVGGPGVISLGGYLAFKSYSYDYFPYRRKWNYTIIGVRSAYHYNGIQSTDFDVYGGLMLGLRSISFSNNEPNFPYDGGSRLILTAFVGGRYYFNNNWGAFIELGSGIGVLNLGVVYKF